MVKIGGWLPGTTFKIAMKSFSQILMVTSKSGISFGWIMRKMYKSVLPIGIAIATLSVVQSLHAQLTFSDSLSVQAKIWSRDANRNIQYSDWKSFSSHTISQIKGFVTSVSDVTDRWGGDKQTTFPATGFFRVVKVSGRWQVIDPEGHPFIVAAVNSIRLGNSAANQKIFQEKWPNKEAWISDQITLFQSLGFNTAGSWSDVAAIQAFNQTARQPFVYTTQLSWLAGYTREAIRADASRKQASVLSFIVDEAFETYCKKHIELLAANRKDANLLGHFSDNEIAFSIAQLDSLLTDNTLSTPAQQQIDNWLAEIGAAKDSLSNTQKEKLIGKIAGRYYQVVSRVIQQADPNHLYLGSRLHASAKNNRYIFEEAAPFVDIVSINYYGYWEPKSAHLSDWASWGNRPFFITEFYTKAMDSGMDNISGAGWLVKTQKERGIHYQNFCLRLLTSPNCVGWHWFRYQDNDPGDVTADPSNRDANKGLVNTQYQLYVPLGESMQELNLNKYRVAAFIFANKLR